MNPSYPVYIISKGRWEYNLRKTSRSLERMKVPYHIVIEPQEYDEYAAVIDPAKILVLPFSNLGQGSIPARNWVWQHAIDLGAKRHWILDDNIRCFKRLNHNRKTIVESGTMFKCAEDFTDRYENIALSGFNYFTFAVANRPIPAYYFCSRIYSCILIKNDLPYRWRGIYNEDTDLSLRALKDGWCTILFNAFLCAKEATMTMTGGNTDLLYQQDGRKRMAKALVEQHPDIVTMSWKFNRWQHQVDYRSFRKKNKLIKKGDLVIPEGINNYGMKLVEITSDGYKEIDTEMLTTRYQEYVKPEIKNIEFEEADW